MGDDDDYYILATRGTISLSLSPLSFSLRGWQRTTRELTNRQLPSVFQSTGDMKPLPRPRDENVADNANIRRVVSALPACLVEKNRRCFLFFEKNAFVGSFFVSLSQLELELTLSLTCHTRKDLFTG